jgi:hypothetical protein
VVTPWRGDARVHLDIAVPSLSDAHAHLLACGAEPLTGTPEEEGHPDDLYRVYADPVGHVLLRHPGLAALHAVRRAGR